MNRTGILLALLSSILFGASTPFAKLLLGAVDPWMMAGLLYLGAGLGLAAMHASRAALRLPAVEAPLRQSDLPWLVLVILAGGVGGPLLLMFGLANTHAGTASLLLNLEGLATMGIAWLAFRENVDRRLLLGAFAILAGAALLSWQGSASLSWGALLIAGACLCWGIDNNLTRKLSSADPVQTAMLKGLFAGSVNLVLALARGASLPPGGTIAAAGLVGFLGYGVSLALFVAALRHLGAARTGAYFSLAPFVGAALAVVMLGDPLSASLVIAGALMALGLGLHLRSGTITCTPTRRWRTSTAIGMTPTTSTRTNSARRRGRTRTGTRTPPWCIGIRTIPISITGTVTATRAPPSVGPERQVRARRSANESGRARHGPVGVA
jgi:drug/metabolite transporter (DMT)-like permease